MIIRLAEQSDEVQLRRLMRETVLPGHIRMVYAREPDFFAAFGQDAENTEVIVVEDEGEIKGVASRTIRRLYVNGEPRAVGYLSGLRLEPSVRNGTTLARGYAFLRERHERDATPAYLTTIIQGNERARAILTSGRAGLPAYIPLGTYLTHVIPVRKNAQSPKLPASVEILSGTDVSVSDVYDFLNREGRKRQFSPVYGERDDAYSLLRDVGLDNLLVACRNGHIVGTLGIWDQRDKKQHIVKGFSPLMWVLRPLLNLGLWCSGRHCLPSAGEQVAYASAAATCIQDDDRSVYQTLLQAALCRASAMGLHQFVIGMHERDRLGIGLRGTLHVIYRSWVYLVSWDGRAFYNALDDRVPYLEVGTL